ncbi:MAG: NAD(P)H-binding protein [Chloroflexota bacterium]|nr:NAD(P)H-binding protein [Chloroflexota bacterium]
MKIAVFGATGRTGRHVLEQGVRRSHLMTAFTRRPQELTGVQGLQAVVHGDGRNLSEVRDAVRGQDCIIAIISSPGFGASTTVSDVTRNIISAMQETGVRRLICVSSHSLVATRPWLVVKLVKWIFRNPYADLAAMEQAMISSHLDWTIVRATQLIDGPATGKIVIERGGRDFKAGSYQIRRSDLATVLLDSAEQEDAIQAAVEVTGVKS